MPQYQYIALDPAGKRTVGVLSGSSEQAILAELEDRSLVPVNIAEKRQRTSLRRGGLSARRLAEVYIQLADMLEAGVPVLRALRVLAGQRDPRIASVFREVAGAVADGEEFGDALARRPEVFKPTHIAIIRAGEKGGFLEDAVARLGQFVEGQAELKSKLNGAMAYPLMLVSMGFVILVVIFAVLIPKVRPMFDRIDDLPKVTEVVFAIATVTSEYAPIAVGVVAGLVTGLVFALRRPGFRGLIDRFVLRAPAIGPLVRAVAIARFSRMLGTMLSNGVPMLSALDTSKAAAGNSVLERAIEDAGEAVGSGAQLAPSLGKSGLFSGDVIEMLSVGEEAGNIDKVLIRIADTVETRVERLLTNLIRLVEPLMIALIASVVFVIAVSLILPLTQLSNIK